MTLINDKGTATSIAAVSLSAQTDWLVAFAA
jgi:hypothetical protein